MSFKSGCQCCSVWETSSGGRTTGQIFDFLPPGCVWSFIFHGRLLILRVFKMSTDLGFSRPAAVWLGCLIRQTLFSTCWQRISLPLPLTWTSSAIFLLWRSGGAFFFQTPVWFFSQAQWQGANKESRLKYFVWLIHLLTPALRLSDFNWFHKMVADIG